MPQKLTGRNTSLYISRAELISDKDLGTLAPGAKISVQGDPERWKSITVAWPDVSLLINHMGRDDDQLVTHLAGFSDYVYKKLADGKMDASIFELILRIYRTNHVLGVTASPGFDATGRCQNFIESLAAHEKALAFLNPAVGDAELRVLLGPGNQRDKLAKIPAFESSLKRKVRTEAKLKEHGVVVPGHLSLIPGDEEAYLRSGTETARRAAVLLAVAMRGEGVAQDEVMKLIKQNGLSEFVSPKEMKFLRAPTPDKQEMGAMTWRYESLWVLLWALGHVETLGEPSIQCDVKKEIAIIKENLGKGFVEKAKLRKKEEILDAADEIYRLRWAFVEARERKTEPPKNFNADILLEWHIALNWLIHYMNQEWDNVSPDT